MASGYVRKLIDDATVGKLRPTYLGAGETYFIPSNTTLGEYYIVIRIPKRGWICECRGYRFAARSDADCKHVDKAKDMRKRRRAKGKGRASADA